MKKIVIGTLLMGLSVVAFAGDEQGNKEKKKGKKTITKEIFIERQKEVAAKKGVEFDLAHTEKVFARRDKNNDGVLTGEECVTRWAKKDKKEKKSAE